MCIDSDLMVNLLKRFLSYNDYCQHKFNFIRRLLGELDKNGNDNNHGHFWHPILGESKACTKNIED